MIAKVEHKSIESSKVNVGKALTTTNSIFTFDCLKRHTSYTLHLEAINGAGTTNSEAKHATTKWRRSPRVIG